MTALLNKKCLESCIRIQQFRAVNVADKDFSKKVFSELLVKAFEGFLLSRPLAVLRKSQDQMIVTRDIY